MDFSSFRWEMCVGGKFANTVNLFITNRKKSQNVRSQIILTPIVSNFIELPVNLPLVKKSNLSTLTCHATPNNDHECAAPPPLSLMFTCDPAPHWNRCVCKTLMWFHFKWNLHFTQGEVWPSISQRSATHWCRTGGDLTYKDVIEC